MRHSFVVPVLIALAACGGEIDSPLETIEPDELEVAPVVPQSSALASWELVANERLQLTDPTRRNTAYPNPLEVERVHVTLEQDGKLCGDFYLNGALATRRCGGVGAGLPYDAQFVLNGTLLGLRVRDVHGDEIVFVRRVPNRCAEIDRGVFGACELCSDELGVVDVSACNERTVRAASNLKDIRQADPSHVAAPGPYDGWWRDSFAGLTSAGVNENVYKLGVKAYLDKLEAELARVGMPPSQLTNHDYDPYEWYAPSPGSVCPGYSFPGDDKAWVRGGALRCDAMGDYVLASACKAPRESTDNRSFELGIYHAHMAWTNARPAAVDSEDRPQPEPSQPTDTPTKSPELPGCTSSPLVVDVTGEGILLSASTSGARFDLLGTGRAVQTGWLARGALLALDLDQDGLITSGRELFGEATRRFDGRRSSDGFDALRQYDDLALGGNGDGFIDDEDAIFAALRLWTDADRDGVTGPAELAFADEAGLVRVDLAAHELDLASVEPADNDVGLVSDGVFAGGATRSVVDVWFRYHTPFGPES